MALKLSRNKINGDDDADDPVVYDDAFAASDYDATVVDAAADAASDGYHADATADDDDATVTSLLLLLLLLLPLIGLLLITS